MTEQGVEERGGQITLFTKKDCPYCDCVAKTLEKSVEKVLKEIPEGKITWKIVDCTGSNSALCVSLTGSFTVPHVFFNREYIGNCNFTVSLCEKEEDCNLIYKKLRAIAIGPKLDPPFPPPSDALMIKVTEDVACSSQPTEEQLEKLYSIGIKSVINLVSEGDSTFFHGEEQTVKKFAVDFEYYHCPMVDFSVNTWNYVLSKVQIAKKPCLIHCDTGQKAAMVAIITLVEDMPNCTKAQLVEMGTELNVDLTNLAPFAETYLKEKKSLDNKTNGSDGLQEKRVKISS